MNDVDILYIIIFLIVGIILVFVNAQSRKDREKFNEQEARVLENDRLMREKEENKEPIDKYMARNFPTFDAQKEAIRIGGFIENYMWAVSERKKDLAEFSNVCSNGVIAEISNEIMMAKLVYSDVEVKSAEFIDYEIHGQEVMLLCNVRLDYAVGNGKNWFEALYQVRYSYVVRGHNSKRKGLVCPSCGAPISDSNVLGKVCEFCSADISKAGLERTWTVVNIDRLENRLKYMG